VDVRSDRVDDQPCAARIARGVQRPRATIVSTTLQGADRTNDVRARLKTELVTPGERAGRGSTRNDASERSEASHANGARRRSGARERV
jgi:hypothetical protein